MTKDLPAGDALDVLVAEKVMGWHRDEDWGHCEHWFDTDGKDLGADYATPEGAGRGDYYQPDTAWSPSTDIRAAWEVVEKLHLGILPDVDGGYVAGWDSPLGVTAWHELMLYGDNASPEPITWAQADTAPLAICRAALAAVGAL